MWTSNQTEIGISSAQLAAWTTLSTEFINSHVAAESARQASKDATQLMNDNLEAVRGYTQALINLIRSHAETTNDPKVLALAGLDPINPPGPKVVPVAPSDFSATVTPEGWLVVRWKASQPASGVQYRVQRRVNGAGQFTLVDTVGSVKKYTDKSLPFGVDRVEYLVTPVRNNIIGPSGNVFSLQFGVGDGVNFNIASATEQAESKLAA